MSVGICWRLVLSGDVWGVPLGVSEGIWVVFRRIWGAWMCLEVIWLSSPFWIEQTALFWHSDWREPKKANREEKEKFENIFSNFERRRRNLKILSPVLIRKREIRKIFSTLEKRKRNEYSLLKLREEKEKSNKIHIYLQEKKEKS